MRYLVVGLGNVGEKRKNILGSRCVATVDPYQPGATYTSHVNPPVNSYDAVVLATPSDVKLEYLSYFLEAGKHVLMEKPLLIPDSKIGSNLEALAHRSRAVWYTSYNHRFEPNVIAVKKLLDSKFVGTIYHARLVYGNGTVGNIVGSWRESGYGVLEDLGCHLIDLSHYLFGCEASDYVAQDLRSFESEVFDHCIFSTASGKVWLECSWTMWKNTFTIDVMGSRGSIHLNGLSKWGQSELIMRKRVVPSGPPEEQREATNQSDVTWSRDIDEFERCVRESCGSSSSDMRISGIIQGLARDWEATDRA